MSENNEQNLQEYGPEMEPVMGIGKWLITLIVMSIPCINIIMLFVWGFGSENQTRANFCRAYLILMVIGIVLMILFYVIFGAALAATMASMPTGM